MAAVWCPERASRCAPFPQHLRLPDLRGEHELLRLRRGCRYRLRWWALRAAVCTKLSLRRGELRSALGAEACSRGSVGAGCCGGCWGLPLGAPCVVVDIKGAPRDRIDLPFPAQGQCSGRTRTLWLAPACCTTNASFVEVYAADVAARLVAEDAAIAFPADALVDTVRSAMRLLRVVEGSSGLTGKALLRARPTLPVFFLLPRRWSVARGAASHLAVAVNVDACGLLEAMQHLLHLEPCCPDFLRHAAPLSAPPSPLPHVRSSLFLWTI